VNKKDIFEVLIIFLAGGFIGWIVENIIRIINSSVDSNYYFKALFGLTIPFLPVYGFGLVLIFIIKNKIKNKNIFTRFLIYTIILSILELIAGIFTILTIGHNTWDYSNSYMNFLGIIGIISSIFWGILALIAEKILSLIENKFNFS
jgi:uncharacterized membrane protein